MSEIQWLIPTEDYSLGLVVIRGTIPPKDRTKGKNNRQRFVHVQGGHLLKCTKKRGFQGRGF